MEAFQRDWVQNVDQDVLDGFSLVPWALFRMVGKLALLRAKEANFNFFQLGIDRSMCTPKYIVSLGPFKEGLQTISQMQLMGSPKILINLKGKWLQICP